MNHDLTPDTTPSLTIARSRHTTHWLSAIALLALGAGCNQLEPEQMEHVSEFAMTPDGAGSFDASNMGTMTIPARDAGEREHLSVKRLDVRVQIEGRMARTQVTQVFKNHTDQEREGTYAFRLPEGASLSRLAMTVGDELVEGELVEREKARMIYEGIVRKQKDPALLEWTGNNRFTTQIFPIPAKGTKTVIIAYEELLPAHHEIATYQYALPDLSAIRGASRIEDFSFRLVATDHAELEVAGYGAAIEREGDRTSATYHTSDFVAAGPIRARMRMKRARKMRAYQTSRDGAGYFLIDVPVRLRDARTSYAGQELILVIDTSAGLGQPLLEHTLATARALVANAPEDVTFTVMSADLEVTVCGVGLGKEAAMTCLKGSRAGGASNLSAMLAASARRAARSPRASHTILFTDGIASVGELDGELLRAAASEGFASSSRSLHTVAIGYTAYERGLEQLANLGGGHALRALPGASPERIGAHIDVSLQRELLEDLSVVVKRGALDGPALLSTRRASDGEHIAILGRAREAVTLELSGYHARERVSYRVKLPANRAREDRGDPLPRFWARAKIAHLLARDAPRREVVALSLDYGVMSPYTSFLVLENKEAFERYRIARRKERERARAEAASANLERRGSDTSELVGEHDPLPDADGRMVDAVARPRQGFFQPGEEPATEEGTVSSGGGFGMGRASGRGMVGGRRVKKARIVMGSASGGARKTTTPRVYLPMSGFKSGGSCDQTIVHRITRARRGALESCYKSALVKDEKLTGTLTIELTLDEHGEPKVIAVDGKSRREKPLSECARDAFSHTRFEVDTSPEGARCEIAQEIVFEPAVPIAKIPKMQRARLDALLRTKSPTLAQRQEALRLAITLGRAAEARAYLVKISEAFPEEDALRAIVDADVASALHAEMTHIAARDLARLSDPTAPLANPRALLGIVAQLAAREERGAFLETFASKNLHTSMRAQILVAYVEADEGGFDEIWEGWANTFESETLWGALLALEAKADSLELDLDPKKLAVLSMRSRGGSLPTAELPMYFDLAISERRVEEASQRLVEACASKAVRAWCLSRGRVMLDLIEEPTARAALEGDLTVLFAGELEAMRRARRADMGNVELITTSARMLNLGGSEKRARRLLSEIVEFAPHVYAARTAYAGALAGMNDPVGGCGEYAIAVQLDPKERDTFREMMALRRGKKEDAESIKACVLAGVSKLPVKRSLSVLLTWEDPDADVDLHIHEANGTHVSYKQTESSSGGLLYYDITDGFGPEIYVLGSGPAGEYALGLVYYSGSAQHIKATVTVLHDAGSPGERKEVFEVILPESDDEVEVPVTTVTLDYADETIDGSLATP